MPRKKYCSMPMCTNFRGTTEPLIHMFRFPTDENAKKLWLDAINEKNDPNVWKSNSHNFVQICQLHFLPSDVHNVKGQTKLVGGAVPTLNIGMPSPLLESKSSNRCNECNDLRSECDQMKNTLMRERVNRDVEHQRNDDTNYKIKEVDSCEHCLRVFDICKKVNESFLSAKFTNKPCISTYQICKEADRFLKLNLLKGNINFKTIYYSIINNIEVEQIFEEADFSKHPEHKLYLIRTIIDGYVRMKGTFMARNASLELHTRVFRQKFKKLVHFYGQ